MKVTIPTVPWDDEWHHDPGDPMPMPINPPKIKERRLTAVPKTKTPTEVIAERAFTGNLNASDLRYMALALLQMRDELFEAQERIRRLENDLPPKA